MMGLEMTPQQYDFYALDSRHYACAEELLWFNVRYSELLVKGWFLCLQKHRPEDEPSLWEKGLSVS